MTTRIRGTLCSFPKLRPRRARRRGVAIQSVVEAHASLSHRAMSLFEIEAAERTASQP